MTINTYRQPASNSIKPSPVITAVLVVVAVALMSSLGLFKLEDADIVSVPAAICVFYALGVLIVRLVGRGHYSFLLHVFSSAFFLRVAIAFVVYSYLSSISGYGGFEGNDDIWWDLQARLALSGGESLWNAASSQFSPGYVLFNAFIYQSLGISPLAARIGNVFVGALVPVVGFHLALKLTGDERLARKMSTAMIWWPGLLVFSVLQQKDMLLALAMTIGALGLVNIVRDGFHWRSVALVGMGILLGLSLRNLASDILVLMCVFILFYLAVRKARIIAVVVPVVIGIIILLASSLFADILPQTPAVLDVQGQYVNRSQSAFERLSGAVESQDSGISGIILTAPIPVRIALGSLLTLVAPFPPTFNLNTSFQSSLLSLGSPLILFTLPFFFLGVWKTVRGKIDRLTLVLIFPIFATAAANAIAYSGLVARYRIMVEPYMIIVALWAFYSSSTRLRWTLVAVTIGGSVIALLGYILVKILL